MPFFGPPLTLRFHLSCSFGVHSTDRLPLPKSWIRHGQTLAGSSLANFPSRFSAAVRLYNLVVYRS